MAVARAARAALALVAASAAASAAAQVMARPVAIYPFMRSEGAGAEDAQALLESALQRAANRTDDVVLSEPVVVRPACGPAQSAPVECLARVAGDRLLLRAVLHRSERSAAIAVEAVDGRNGRVFGPVTVGIDTYIQNAEPLARALLMLFEDVRGAARRQAGGLPRPLLLPPPLVPAAPPKQEAAKAEAPKADLRAAEPEPASPKAAAQPAAASVARSAPQRPWLRSAAPYCAGAGLALLAGAVVVSMKNESLSDELDRKAAEGTLTPADAASYDKVAQYNTLTAVLAVSGGALTLTGAVLFTVVPSPGGASVAMAGRF
jgi:hypothetical protein